MSEVVRKIESTFQRSAEFHEKLQGLVAHETIGAGFYKPILAAYEEHLKVVKNRIEEFKKEFERVASRNAGPKDAISKELGRRTSGAHPGGLRRRAPSPDVSAASGCSFNTMPMPRG